MAVATSANSQLRRSEHVAEGTMAFHFARPEGFEFRPGQTIDITLLDPPETDAEGNTRTFSIASAPEDHHLMIATRVRDSAFKRVLSKASPGLDLKIEGPGGDFTLHHRTDKAAVFLAGGIGITPFLSMTRHAAHEKTERQLYLFYSNRHPEDAAFLDLLTDTASQHPNIHLIATMTEMEKSHSKWNGETGHIDQQMLTRHLPSLAGPTFYVAGPPKMVAALRNMLVAAHIDEDDIRAEEFPGY